MHTLQLLCRAFSIIYSIGIKKKKKVNLKKSKKKKACSKITSFPALFVDWAEESTKNSDIILFIRSSLVASVYPAQGHGGSRADYHWCEMR